MTLKFGATVFYLPSDCTATDVTCFDPGSVNVHKQSEKRERE